MPASTQYASNRDDLRSLLVAAIAGLAINFLSSLLSWLFALFLVAICLGAIFVLFRPRTSRGGEDSLESRSGRSAQDFAFLAASVVVGAGLGGLSILIVPDTSLDVPWTDLFDPSVFDYGGQFHGYELLASSLVAAAACVALTTGQKLVRVLGFAVGAVGGAMAVFSAFGPYFFDPLQTFLGWSLAVAALLSILNFAPRGFRTLGALFRFSRAASDVNAVASTSDELRRRSASSLEDSSAGPNSSNAPTYVSTASKDHAPPIRDEKIGDSGNAAPEIVKSKRHTSTLGAIVAVSLISVSVLTLIVVQLGPDDALFGVLIIVLAISCLILSTFVFILLSDWKYRKATFAGLTATVAFVGLVLAYMQIQPSPSQASHSDVPSSAESPSVTPTERTGPSPWSVSGSAATPTPILSSEAEPTRVEVGTVYLEEAHSTLIETQNLRVAAGSVYITSAVVRLSTDDKLCEANLDVGQAIVLTNRSPGEDDYSRWYAAALEAIDGRQATLAWSVGTGKAPAADSGDSCK